MNTCRTACLLLLLLCPFISFTQGKGDASYSFFWVGDQLAVSVDIHKAKMEKIILANQGCSSNQRKTICLRQYFLNTLAVNINGQEVALRPCNRNKDPKCNKLVFLLNWNDRDILDIDFHYAGFVDFYPSHKGTVSFGIHQDETQVFALTPERPGIKAIFKS